MVRKAPPGLPTSKTDLEFIEQLASLPASARSPGVQVSGNDKIMLKGIARTWPTKD